MAQPLGLTPGQHAAYLQLLGTGSYRPTWGYDTLDLDDNLVGEVPVPEDGVITVSVDDEVARSTTGRIWDPDHQVQLDTDNPLDGQMHFDRLLAIRHTVTVPDTAGDLGGPFDVTAIPFYGWITKANRNGEWIDLEAQGLERRALFGCPPLAVQSGTRVDLAIRTILEQRCGETRFRFAATTARLPKAVSVGWDPEIAPWKIAKKLADSINYQLLYSSDGWCTLRPFPTTSVVDFTWPQPGSGQRGNITVEPVAELDALTLTNHARVTGKGKVVAERSAPADHPLAPRKIARHGVPLYMANLVADDAYSTKAKAAAAAERLVTEGLAAVYDQQLTTSPLYHLDELDVAAVSTPSFSGLAKLRRWTMATNGADTVFNRNLQVAAPKVAAIRG